MFDRTRNEEYRLSMSLNLNTGVGRILRERVRQETDEGWTAEHDDAHADCSLAQAAAYYASTSPGTQWPKSWDSNWNKSGKHSRIRQLEIAGALIAAEIDRLLRAGVTP